MKRADKSDAAVQKKYRVSKFANGTYIIGLVGIIACDVLTYIFQLISDDNGDADLMHWLMKIGVAGYLWLLLFDIGSYKFSISESGIVMYTGMKTHSFTWDEFEDWGTFDVNVSSPDVVSTFWIYFSKKYVTIKEKDSFLRKKRYDLKNIAFFQYSSQIYDEIKVYFPEKIRSSLDEEIGCINVTMTRQERRINK